MPCIERGVRKVSQCKCGASVVRIVHFSSKGAVRYGDNRCKECRKRKSHKGHSKDVRSVRNGKRFTDEECLQMFSMLDAGATSRDVAREFGCNETSVCRIKMRREEIEKRVMLNAAVAPPEELNQGACAKLYARNAEDLQLFFPEKHHSTLLRRVKREYCDDCPVKRACFEHAMKNEHYGNWAGTSQRQRARARLDSDYFEKLQEEVVGGER